MTVSRKRGSEQTTPRNPDAFYPTEAALSSVLLIHPPVTKPCEPPAGIGKLAGALQAYGVPYSLIDANLEGMLFLLGETPAATDTWTRRAHHALPGHLVNLRNISFYGNGDRYRRAVSDLNHLLMVSGHGSVGSPGLCDYTSPGLSPVRLQDLLRSAQYPGSNPFYGYMAKALRPRLETLAPDLVGISVSYLSQALTAFALAGFIRSCFPRAKIVMGGSLITSWMAYSSWSPAFSGLIDRFVAGPGEAPLLELLGGRCHDPVPCPPLYDGLPLEDYLSPGLVLPYAASSGCYWARCSFCPEKAEGHPYRPVSPPDAMSHLEELSARLKPRLVHLVDNAVSPAMLRAMANRPSGLSWYGFVRPSPELADREFCLALRRSGCVMLKLGIESGDQGVLDALEKGTTVENASAVLAAIHDAGIGTYVYLLFGTPFEGRREAEKTLAFTAAHSRSIDFLNLALFNLPLNSPDAARLDTARFYEGDLPLYVDFTHPSGWGRREVRHFLDREFKRHPSIAGILRNQPPFFTSNHAPFVAMAKK